MQEILCTYDSYGTSVHTLEFCSTTPSQYSTSTVVIMLVPWYSRHSVVGQSQTLARDAGCPLSVISVCNRMATLLCYPVCGMESGWLKKEFILPVKDTPPAKLRSLKVGVCYGHM